MNSSILLLRPGLLSFKNSINKDVILKRLPFIIIGIIFWILFYIATYKVLSYVRGIEFFGELISKKLFSMIFFSLTGFLILSNIITAISSFYLSRDIPFLLSIPVEIKDILNLKSVETIMNSSWMVISFIPPVFIAYGTIYKAPLSYYIFTAATFIPFIFITAGTGILIAHVLTRLFPAKRVRDVLLAIGLLLFLGLYFVLRSITPLDTGTPEGFISSIMTFRINSHILPGYWITEAIFPVLKNRDTDLFYIAILLSNGAFLFMLSVLIGERLYRRNLERIQPAGKGFNKGLLQDFYPNYKSAILWKDTKIFFRDTGQWSQLFIIGALMMVYIYNFKTIPVKAISGLLPYIKELMVLINMVMTGLVLSAVSARFLYSSVSLEGEAFWIIRASPVVLKKFLWSKLLYGSIPVSVVIVALVFITNIVMDVTGLLMFLSVGTALMLCISISGLGTGLGAMYPKFKYENIASVSMNLGGIAFMLIAFTVVLLTVLLEAWPVYLYHRATLIGHNMNMLEKVQSVLCAGLIVIINVIAFYLPMRMGIKRLEKD
ncbi:MAG: hypothetical protein AB1348_03545 [Nitrospirota bacterium]